MSNDGVVLRTRIEGADQVLSVLGTIKAALEGLNGPSGGGASVGRQTTPSWMAPAPNPYMSSGPSFANPNGAGSSMPPGGTGAPTPFGHSGSGSLVPTSGPSFATPPGVGGSTMMMTVSVVNMTAMTAPP